MPCERLPARAGEAVDRCAVVRDAVGALVIPASMVGASVDADRVRTVRVIGAAIARTASRTPHDAGRRWFLDATRGGDMPDLTKAEVAALLRLQGYDVPEPDLSEIVHRVNALAESLVELDALDVFHVEPWPVQPLRRPDHA